MISRSRACDDPSDAVDLHHGTPSRKTNGEFRVPPSVATLSPVVLVFLITLVGAVRQAQVDVVSIFDEGFHLSYVGYVAQGYLPRKGDPLHRWGELAYSCYPVAAIGRVVRVPCGVDADTTEYPAGGRNTAAIWPPGYYLVAAPAAKFFTAISGADPLHATRWVSAILWALGSSLFVLIALRLSGSRVQSVAVGVLVGTAPFSWPLRAYVTPHAFGAIVSAAVIVVALWACHRTRSYWITVAGLASVAVGAVLFIPQSIAVLTVAAVALAVLIWWPSRQYWKAGVAAVALTIPAVITFKLWDFLVSFRESRPDLTSDVVPIADDRFWVDARDNWDLFWPSGFSPGPMLSPVESQFAVILGLVSAVLAGFWILQKKELPQKALALGLVIGGPVMGIWFAYTLPFSVPSRYGATLIPVALVLLARTSSGGIYRALSFGLAVASLIMSWSTGYMVDDVPGG